MFENVLVWLALSVLQEIEVLVVRCTGAIVARFEMGEVALDVTAGS